VLSRPRELSNLLADLLPDATRISKILVAAAQDRVAEKLRQHTSDGWTAVVTADRAYLDGVVADCELAASIEFPRDYPERRLRLSGRSCGSGGEASPAGLSQRST
jgi:hypothetical protein